MTSSDYVIFILTNGRPEKVYTYDTLRRSGYTGPIKLIVDDLDPTIDLYRDKFKDEIEVFSKKEAAAKTDSIDNSGTLRGVVYARNACWDVAKKLNIKYFIQLDDDYRSFKFRFSEQLDYRPRVMKNLDRVFSCVFDFLKTTNISSIACAQGGDFIGGEASAFADAVTSKRKCMNAFFCSTERPINFLGRINEDVNAYVSSGAIGKIFFTTNQFSLEQVQTQTNSGGLTELYLDLGTYVKSFFSVICAPSAVKVRMLNDRNNPRPHHSVTWKNAVPVILRESR